MLPPPFFVNNAILTSFKEGKEDFVKITYGHYCPVAKMDKDGNAMRDELGKVVFEENFVVPVVSLMMTRASYKKIMKAFQGFLARQDEGIPPDLPGFPKKEGM